MRRLVLLSLIASLPACEPKQREMSIPFTVEFNGQVLRCDDSATVSLSDLRLFVHDVEFRDASGAAVTGQLVRDGTWQSRQVAMLDLETGTGACDDGTLPVNDALQVSIPGDVSPETMKGLGFTLGVPFELNHDDPLKAAPPLDDSSMHWHWRSGYKFLRAGVETADDGFWLHLGSTACRGTTGNISGCDQPNRVRVELAGFRPGHDGVVIDIGRLFDGIDLEDGIRSDCSSGPTEPACPDVLSAFGLGESDGELSRGVFTARPLELASTR